MELFREKEDCCGCSACMSICPVGAITMKSDAHGFEYPYIDEKKCIDCGRCRSVCPLNNQEGKGEKKDLKAFAVKNRDENIRRNSSSGGVFYELAKDIIQRGGTVYGACFDEDFQVLHLRGESLGDVCKMQGSKYVQSNLAGIFKSVKEDLMADKTVLFTGCPCQVDGLKQYLKDCKKDGLVTCDLICHGVNSPRVWKDYLAYISRKRKIQNIYFRDKLWGWHEFSMKIQMNQKEYLESPSYDFFFQAFFSSFILRNSCFSCKYANLYRKSDITIGDFWGIEHVFPEFDDDKGVSLVLVNTPEGQEYFSHISENVIVVETEIEDCMQPSLRNPVKRPNNYDKFWEDYLDRGFAFICKKYLGGGLKGKIRKLIKKALIKTGLWNQVKRLVHK
ncbi:Coenzyme F420 hydrogenase/dehydrogenase, beta subunit C-terminal domain [Acetatifactor muris]|uniref:Ferredoxin n=1 Tax=Acetatifactor muris TaxID=879566 RepID=A0A2K4ZJW0_9FIRM|nr:Coenzyme F420 hydrogenase/dehydrogenase, beta subunit C-terminal domain [Acetatifactor muris]MCR2049083.1 Coenzyme F420 hydrogenase/dehydrogenase, beta subunit C-terminal domain [Acetatifactor muris]SOY30774.1 Ferredoxin [Acetatifactor muris]